MKKIFFAALYVGASLCGYAARSGQHDMTLWYKSPASEWVEALPIGNGRLGAMIHGGVNEELIQLNEESLWSGRPINTNPNPEAVNYLPQVREALFAGEWDKAKDLCRKMQGYYTQSYLPLGDLKITYDYDGADATDYYRGLDIADAICSTSYRVGDVTYQREFFASAPDDLIIGKISTDKKGALTFTISLESQLNNTISDDNDGLIMKGIAPVQADPNYVDSPNPIIYEIDGHKGMRFALKVSVDAKNGTVQYTDSTVSVKGADEAVIKISAATSFNGMHNDPYTQGKDEIALVNKPLNDSRAKKYDAMRKAHIKDYRGYFDRVSLNINDGKASTDKDIFERLVDYREGADDPALEALYFQLGRYLLISSSRPDGVPANLQGIWNHHLRAPWSSNYTTNINAEMNYWPAEAANLSEMQDPFIRQIIQTSDNGAETAKNFYGARGWALSHNSDIWGQTNPVGNLGDGDPMWANWYMGSPWVSQHLYERYRFTNDKDYLANEAYPVMKDAALFCLDWLVDDNKGHLVTAPSSSPENSFIGEDGKGHSTTIASTMDMSIIYDLFTNVIEAAEILGIDQDFAAEIAEARSKLYPLQIGSKGNLQEWIYDYEDVDPHHRHVSHLFGLHPGHQITPFDTPDFAKASRKTLKMRGDDGTGWSLAWKINFWSRLLDGDHAYVLLRNLMRIVTSKKENYRKGGGSYANLFCAHPPFQIDGNFGGLAGMTEMMLQSQNGEIHLLPAIPTAWKSGEVKGLKARGNVEVDIAWDNGTLTKGTIKINYSGKKTIRTSVPVKVKGAKATTERQDTEWGTYYVTTFDSKSGKTYTLTADK